MMNSLQTQPTNDLLFFFFSLLGLLSLSKLSLSLLRSLYTYFLRPPKDLRSHYGSWAVVTGPTDGIGKAIAFELARKNLNLILVGRNPHKLDRVSAGINEKFKNVEIKRVVLDLSGDLTKGIQELKAVIEEGGVDVGVLVNNAGVMNLEAAFFHEGDVEVWAEVVRVNLAALTAVTGVVVPMMLERGRGAIVNVGSGSSGAVPSFPLYSVYAATKACTLSISPKASMLNTNIKGLMCNARFLCM